MSGPWFAGRGRGDADEAFLARLRAACTERGLADAPSTATRAEVCERLDCLAVVVEVPGLTATQARPTLQVGVDVARPFRAVTWETWGYTLDLFEEVDLAGASRTPATLADEAHAWFAAQLARPVERRTWTGGDGGRSRCGGWPTPVRRSAGSPRRAFRRAVACCAVRRRRRWWNAPVRTCDGWAASPGDTHARRPRRHR
ncbi:hypothetical protein [Blastococcus sp. SYSU D00820]